VLACNLRHGCNLRLISAISLLYFDALQ
jgi:hypothetical protein